MYSVRKVGIDLDKVGQCRNSYFAQEINGTISEFHRHLLGMYKEYKEGKRENEGSKTFWYLQAFSEML